MRTLCRPRGGCVTLDANVHFGRKDGSWDLALLGRNITNRIYVTGSESGPLATPGITGDLYAFVNRPYELTLQLTVRPTFEVALVWLGPIPDTCVPLCH